jgi:hypothetical protein
MEKSREKWIVALLAANFVVLCLIAIGLVASFVALRDKGSQLAGAAEARGAGAQRALVARSRQTADALDPIARRRTALEPVASGMMGKLDQEIRLMQVMSDEQLLLLQHLAGTQEALATAGESASSEAPQGRSARPPRR